MKPKIYIDGKEGTTGLQIYERLGGRDDIELLLIDEDKRKDIEERRKFLNAADIAFLCLPDAAAKEAVSLIENDTTRVIDASTAHRTDPDWDYGFAELSKAHREAIKNSKRVANPGCHASGFISSVYPLVANGIIAEDTALTCASLTGYSGGGKKMIAEIESPDRAPELYSPYEGQQLVTVAPFGGEEPMIYANTLAGHDSLKLIVCGHEEQTIVTALFDNLGKGASGAAVQNMNIMLGLDETTGLNL